MSRIAEELAHVDLAAELEALGLTGKVSGKNFIALCPFHKERSPSFGMAVDGEKRGLYNCYGCGARGTFYDLAAHLKGTGREQERVEYAERREPEREASDIAKRLDDMVGPDTLHDVCEYVITNAAEIEGKFFKRPYGPFLEYLYGRRIDDGSIERHRIMCCDQEAMRWGGRVVIPVEDHAGRVVAYFGRSIGKSARPQMNTRTEGLRNVLFGSRHAQGRAAVVLVEGPFDAIYLQQCGIPAVAMMKKEVSDGQVRTIASMFVSVVLCLDGDTSNKDVEKVRAKLEDFVQVFVYRIRDRGKDPDELDELEMLELAGLLKTAEGGA